ncbi:GNAT family N-acetyltransferase [Amycolatopsis jiangsuensis]|uniref:GNAT family N-acetyltransferase n=1 Tax=Amycolatopsis jiangsuensis TaxID=1181879 RepID=UPI00160F9E9A|nr:GNAT family N-acetyltransferase [Amycolatopsis jiangsuensis]
MRWPLGNPAWAALDGPHAPLAERKGQVLRYPTDVSPFLAVPDHPDAGVWQDIADLAGPASTVAVVGGVDLPLPEGWAQVAETPAVQMEGTALPSEDPAVVGVTDQLGDTALAGDRVALPATSRFDALSELVRLTDADVPEMLDLVARTRPGPFLARTVMLGNYLGIRHDGALVAMAGERLRPPGWTEISAVCTDPAFRGHGLAGRLVQAVVAGIRSRGDEPFLHAAAVNTGAIRLYEQLGFRLNRTVRFTTYRTPDR